MSVQSDRSVYEKKPWKDLPSLTGIVEKKFVRPAYSGESVFPYLIGQPLQAVAPVQLR